MAHPRRGVYLLASAPAGLEAVATIPNPIDVGAWPLREHKDDYLLWVGRMTAEKGPASRDRAARAADVPPAPSGHTRTRRSPPAWRAAVVARRRLPGLLP
ncbi:MAG: hypothetical protein ACR2H2_08600 [Solirubrobacteraceae bacterium]